MTTKEFIENTLIDEIGSLIPAYAYLSFSLICIGIEFIGKCLDEESEWDTRNKSREHFKSGLSLFPSRYQIIYDTLYEDLRCGMAHGFNPKSFKLGELKNDGVTYEDHLIMRRDVLIIEHFYKDFVTACRSVIDKEFPTTSKVNKDYLHTDLKL